MQPPQQTPGAVVIGGDYQGLAIVRSLGRRGVPVLVVDHEPSIAMASRYATLSVRVPGLRDERQTVDALMEQAAQHDLRGWVLFPTREETVAALSRHRDELGSVFRVPTPPWSTIERAWDKRRTQELAEQLGIPVARTWTPRTAEDVERVAAEATLPVILKPSIKEHFFYATGAKAWRVDRREDLAPRYREAAAIAGEGEILVQELLPGDPRGRLAFCTFFKDGAAVAGLTACRARQHPHDFGRHSTYVQTVDFPLAEELATRFLAAIGYYGLAEVEFMLDPRDGHLKLLDVNARTWGYHSIGVPAGVDFPWLLYADQLGLPVEPVRGRSGVRWVRLLTDTPTAARDVLAGRLGVRAYGRSLRGLNTEASASFDDPLPALAEVALLPYLLATRGL